MVDASALEEAEGVAEEFGGEGDEVDEAIDDEAVEQGGQGAEQGGEGGEEAIEGIDDVEIEPEQEAGAVVGEAGDEDKLTGGVLGGAVWADWALPFAPASGWSGFASLGLSANQKGDAIEDQQNTLIPFGGAGLFYRLIPQLELGAQYIMHGPLFDDAEIDALKKAGGQIVFGGRWLGAGWSLDVAVQEDIITHSSPDFSLHVGLRLQPE